MRGPPGSPIDFRALTAVLRSLWACAKAFLSSTQAAFTPEEFRILRRTYPISPRLGATLSRRISMADRRQHVRRRDVHADAPSPTRVAQSLGERNVKLR